MSRLIEHHNRSRRMLEILDADTADLNADDRAARFGKMAASPYAFFRGANALYWADVWHDWRFALFGGLPETQTWLQGDAHAFNFGAYGHHNDTVRYGMDDFDDALIADYQYDLWRLTSSVVLDGRENVGLKPEKIAHALKALVEGYHDELRKHLDGTPPLSVTLVSAPETLAPFLEKIARKQSRARMLDKWTKMETQGRRFAERPEKLAGLPAHLASQLRSALTNEYRGTLGSTHAAIAGDRFVIRDLARRLDAGTGSLGIDRYYAIISDSEDSADDVILDIKAQSRPTAWQRMSARNRRAWKRAFEHEGIRHAAAFRAIAEHPDPWLGWLHMDDQVFSVRERSPFKKDFPTHRLSDGKAYRRVTEQWGRILARSHLRGAQALWPEDPPRFARCVCEQLDARPERFLQVVTSQAFAYADCTTRDYHIFVSERVEALKN